MAIDAKWRKSQNIQKREIIKVGDVQNQERGGLGRDDKLKCCKYDVPTAQLSGQNRAKYCLPTYLFNSTGNLSQADQRG